MSFAQPTDAAATADRATFAARFGWLVYGIDRLGMRLTRLLSRDVPEKGATADQCEAWLLVSRSVRWLHALQARFARGDVAGPGEAAPARAAAPDVVAAGDARVGDAKAGDAEAPNAAGASAGKAKRQRLRTADDEIRGKSTEAVVARISADLGTAAGLLGDAEAARRAAWFAERARALLNGEPEPAIDPRSPAFDVPVPARDAGAAMPHGALPHGANPAPAAPDTG